jgi:GntR family transcriptional regulator/MocR family aminotransferase
MRESELQRHGEVSLARQIYLQLRERIIAGSLPSGEILPSTRELARQLAVSRNTVYEAYEMLAAEGYTLSRPGAPTRVAEGICLGMSQEHEKLKVKLPSIPRYIADFRTGRPDLRQFPRTVWQQLLCRAAQELSIEEWGYIGPEGLSSLRAEIASWLLRSRGLKVFPEDIFITAGATQALSLLAALLPRQQLIVEDPCHMGMLRVFKEKAFTICPVPVDEQGIKTGYLARYGAAAVYVTPSHQFPLGGILPAGRRAELIRFARLNKSYIIEDDYDSEFRYNGSPIAPLWAMDNQRVIYVGTFSKILFPGLRIGYVILPHELKRRWCKLRTFNDVQNPPFAQAALAEYLKTRKLDRHVQKMRRLYGRRRQIFLAQMKEVFGETWSAWGDAAGLHLALAFPGKCFDQSFIKHCQKNGLRVTPAEYHSITKGRHLDKLIFGYGHLEPAEINKGVRLLNKVFTDIF